MDSTSREVKRPVSLDYGDTAAKNGRDSPAGVTKLVMIGELIAGGRGFIKGLGIAFGVGRLLWRVNVPRQERSPKS